MAENTKRSLFGLHGIFGVLISIVGLLVILVVLQLLVVVTQRNAAENPYDPTAIRDINNLKQIDVANKQYAFIDAEKKDK
jgi:CHASE1-domain containing sensor protein